MVRHMWVSPIAKKGCFYDMVVDALSDVDDLTFENQCIFCRPEFF